MKKYKYKIWSLHSTLAFNAIIARFGIQPQYVQFRIVDNVGQSMSTIYNGVRSDLHYKLKR